MSSDYLVRAQSLAAIQPERAPAAGYTPAPRNPAVDQARALVAALRAELGWPIAFERVVAELAPADREALGRVVVRVREARGRALSDAGG